MHPQQPWSGEERRDYCARNIDCPHLESAAERAVAKVFAILGVDVNKPESVEEFREDLRFGKRLRKAAGHGTLAVVSLLAAGMVAALWSGISIFLKK